MGLYLKIQPNYDTNEERMLLVIELLIEKMKKYFNFKVSSKYILWYQDYEEQEIESYESLDVKKILNFIESHRTKIKEKEGTIAHYTISVEGVIELQGENGNINHMIVDVFGTCSRLKDMYGNVWINFYNTTERWQNYFIGDNNNSNKNREKIYKLINDLKIPDFSLHSIFFAESNIVFDVLNKAYYLYFKEYKFFIEYILRIIKERLTEKNLEYEDILISEEKRPILSSIKDDLKLYDLNELVDIMDRTTIQFSNKYKDFITVQYKKRVEYSTIASVEIKERFMDSKIIRKALTDYLGNFISSLNETLPKYNYVEKRIKSGFTQHEFKPEIKKKQTRF